MKIYCSNNTLKISDIYKDFLGTDLWVLAYHKNFPYDEYLNADYMRFVAKTQREGYLGIEECLQYNCIDDYDVNKLKQFVKTGLSEYLVKLERKHTDSIKFLDRMYDVVMPLEIYSTEDLLDLIAEEPDDEGEDW